MVAHLYFSPACRAWLPTTSSTQKVVPLRVIRGRRGHSLTTAIDRGTGPDEQQQQQPFHLIVACYTGDERTHPYWGEFFFSRDFPTSPHPALPPYVVSDLTLRDLFFMSRATLHPGMRPHHGSRRRTRSRRSSSTFLFFAAHAASPADGPPTANSAFHRPSPPSPDIPGLVKTQMSIAPPSHLRYSSFVSCTG